MSSNFSVLTLGDGLITMNPADDWPFTICIQFLS